MAKVKLTQIQLDLIYYAKGFWEFTLGRYTEGSDVRELFSMIDSFHHVDRVRVMEELIVLYDMAVAESENPEEEKKLYHAWVDKGIKEGEYPMSACIIAMNIIIMRWKMNEDYVFGKKSVANPSWDTSKEKR